MEEERMELLMINSLKEIHGRTQHIIFFIS
jgi:hypothetical protein